MNEIMNKEELKEIIASYAQKVFFYCVKRCNNRMDAEDLSQTIILECINNINKGTIIENVDYYVWGVCKNQYNQYLRKVIKTTKNLSVVEEIDVVSDEPLILDKLVEDEKIKMINTSIKLLSKDYTQILYAYYVEDKTLKFISEELNMPLGTVKWKLSKIREQLKEYLKMERLNGKKAYLPKNFVGVMSGNTYFNMHEFLDPLIIKNFLYHSYGNPCSVEDYSIELGISRPYVENFIDILLNKELLIKTEDYKYLTNIAFIDKNLRRDIYDIVRENINGYANEVFKFCKENLEYYKSILLNKDILDEELMWSLILITLAVNETRFEKRNEFTKRKDGSNWDYLLMENLDKIYDDEFFISWNTNRYGSIVGITFPASTSDNKHVVAKTISYEHALDNDVVRQLMYEIKKHNLTYSSLTEDVKVKVDTYIDKNYLKVVDDKLYVTSPTFKESDYNNLISLIKNNSPIYNELNKIYEAINNKLETSIPNNLKEQFDFIINACCLTRSLVLTKAYDEDLIKDYNKEKGFPYNTVVVIE